DGDRTRRRRRRIADLLALSLVVGSLLVAANERWLNGQSHAPAAPATPTKPAVPATARAEVPTAYHIVYRVTTGRVANTEDLWVHRPFEAEDTIYAGSPKRPKDGQAISSIVTRLGRQLVRT